MERARNKGDVFGRDLVASNLIVADALTISSRYANSTSLCGGKFKPPKWSAKGWAS
ncbi:hypothetical protein SAMN05446934_6467 [Paraburkholderia hospita]|nr:hypothetical protein SAMN05446934_6467 [Paraburkholderia hospita]